MSAKPGETLLARVRRRIARSEGITAITGAGLSAESGLTGYAADGSNFPPEYAAVEAFREDPVGVWQWYDARRQEIARALPNPGHRALARLEAGGKSVFIATLNLDDLHERAGSTQVIHVNGSLWRVRCDRDGFGEENREVPIEHLPPYCPCGRELRPDIVWYGERLPAAPVAAVRAHLLEARSNVLLVVGIEVSFGPVLEWAHEAREQGMMVVTVNPGATAVDAIADLHIPGRAGNILPGLMP